jgi:molecular chaperone DnaK
MGSDTPKFDKEKDLFIGIDLGTTNSVISFWDPVQERAIPFSTDFSKYILPSVVTYVENEKTWVFGTIALNRETQLADVTIRSIKRHMHENYLTPEIAGKRWTPVEISSMILRKLVSFAEGEPRGRGPVPGSKIRYAIICHPYDFDQEAKKRTKEAAIKAMPDVSSDDIVLIEEPTAAAIGYGLLHELRDGETVLVFDLGGGTFDITVFKAELSVDKGLILKVLALDGDEHLGGDDFDEILLEYFRAQWHKHGFTEDINADTQRARKLRKYLRRKAEEAKVFLADTELFNVILQDPDDLLSEPLSFDVSQKEFNALTEELFERVENKCRDALAAAQHNGLEANVDHVLLVGGSTNMIRIKNVVEDVFGKLPAVPPDKTTLVSIGAAIYSAMRSGLTKETPFSTLPFERVSIDNILPHPIGIRAKWGTRDVFMQIFAKGTRFPVESDPKTFLIDGTSPEEKMEIWEARSSERVNFCEIEDIINLHKGMKIGTVTFSGTEGSPRKVLIHFAVTEDGILTGKFEDTKKEPGKRAPQEFSINSFVDSRHRL